MLDIEIKRDYDSEQKKYLETIKSINVTVYFPGFLREKLIVKLPADAIALRQIKEWADRLVEEEAIPVTFENLTISLVQGKDLGINATAEGMSEIEGEIDL